MTRRRKVVLSIAGALVGLVALLALLGSVRDIHIVTVTRSTDACRDAMWDLWADVPARTEWDKGLDYIELDGPFEAGTTGTVKVQGQDPIAYEVVEVVPQERYTDRFKSLPWTHTDWHHTIEPNDQGGYDVTWRLEARGPLSILTLPVTTSIFGAEVPGAVDEFVGLAESRC